MEEKIFGKEKRNLEIGVQELVRRTSKAQNRVIQIGPKTFKNRNDKVGQLLIDFYDKHEGHGDIQKELNKHFVAGAMENLQEREKERKLKKLDFPDDVDEKVKKEALEELEKNGEVVELSEEELQSEVYKSIYERVFQDYSDLMMKLKDQQIKEDSLTIGDKEGTELIIYERYLTGIEMANYRAGGESFSEDSRIAGLRKEFKKEFDDRQERVDEVTRESIDNLEQLYAEKNEVVEKISYLNLNPQLATQEQMASLRERYQKISFQIREQDPSLEEFSRQVAQIEENQKFANEVGVGENSSTDRDRAGMAIDSTRKINLEDSKELNQDTFAETKDNIEDIQKLDEQEMKLKEIRKKEFIKRYNEAKRKNDILTMNVLVSEYRGDIEVERLIEDDTDRSNPEVAEDEFEYTNFIGGLDAINSDDEIIEAMDKSADETLENADKNIEDQVRDTGTERTRGSFNNWN